MGSRGPKIFQIPHFGPINTCEKFEPNHTRSEFDDIGILTTEQHPKIRSTLFFLKNATKILFQVTERIFNYCLLQGTLQDT